VNRVTGIPEPAKESLKERKRGGPVPKRMGGELHTKIGRDVAKKPRKKKGR